ncbi:hypothetical protein GGR42_001728 [Saonia flava]|uniref:DUF4386 domain-containing protein n=1 Tax=Saonia flava TaxID=523696 RepID=A0A846QQF8_9FLAO|nr:DUF4386 domain-containing protein [Saonia flava]NJB71266.1 hypothetical protein [Saonia flava]
MEEENEILIYKKARIAGLLYCFVFAGGFFAEVFVRQKLMVYGDPIATATNILANESLYRWGFAISLLYLICNIPIALIFYNIFKRADKFLAALLLLFFLTGNTVEIVNIINHYTPLDVLKITSGVNGFNQNQSSLLAYLSLNAFTTGFGITLVFFACYDLVIGLLILKSKYLPKLIGILMLMAGVCYLTNSFSLFLYPEFAEKLFPFVLFPCFVGELVLALWLTFKGIKLLRYTYAK